MKKIIVFSLLFVFLISSVSLVLAGGVIPEPNAFYGKVEYRNGDSIPDGYIVTAGINGIITGSCKVKDGKYGYGSDTLIVLDYSGDGGIVKFYINNEKADQEIEFEAKGVTNLDLTVKNPPSSEWTGCGDGKCDVDADECLSCPVDCDNAKTDVCCGDGICGIELYEDENTCPEDCEEEDDNDGPSGGGGSSGGPSGGGGSKTTPTTCTENWICGLWTECINGQQTRYCKDLNKCGTTYHKPEQERSCVPTTKGIEGREGQQPESTGISPTGAVIGARTLSLIGLYALAIIVAIVAATYLRARMSRGKVKAKTRVKTGKGKRR